MHLQVMCKAEENPLEVVGSGLRANLVVKLVARLSASPAAGSLDSLWLFLMTYAEREWRLAFWIPARPLHHLKPEAKSWHPLFRLVSRVESALPWSCPRVCSFRPQCTHQSLNMAAATPKTVQGDICPDPSAHHNPRNSKLQDQASKAALSVTHPGDKGSDGRRSIDALGPDGKLSSAGKSFTLNSRFQR